MVKELKTVNKSPSGYVNAITEELDKYILKPIGDFHHYIYPIKDTETNSLKLYLRYPGYTTGMIVIDDDLIITEIKFNNTFNNYNNDIYDALKKFIGMRIIRTKSENKIIKNYNGRVL